MRAQFSCGACQARRRTRRRRQTRAQRLAALALPLAALLAELVGALQAQPREGRLGEERLGEELLPQQLLPDLPLHESQLQASQTSHIPQLLGLGLLVGRLRERQHLCAALPQAVQGEGDNAAETPSYDVLMLSTRIKCRF